MEEYEEYEERKLYYLFTLCYVINMTSWPQGKLIFGILYLF